MPPKAQGRMIKKDISNSNGFASLSSEAAVLFAMLIPHYNAHGKMNGGPGYIKDEICPKIPYLTYKNISLLLKEINEKTNVKWFKNDGRYWIQSLNFLTEHQDLRPDRMGPDLLPEYSWSGNGVVPLEVKEEVEDKVKEEGKGKGNSEKVPYAEIISDFNRVLGTSYRSEPLSKSIKELVDARWYEGNRLEDFKKVHRNMQQLWQHDPKMSKFLRPQTLYTGKFEGYLNTKITLSDQGKISPLLDKSKNVFKEFAEEQRRENAERSNIQ